MSLPPNQIVEFGPFRLDRAERVLLRDGRPVPLTLKAFEVLLMLVESSGHIVEKDALMNRVWAGSFVEEGNLKVTVSVLRKVLGEDQGTKQYIETVPRRGYRFVAEIKPTSESVDLVVQERPRAGLTIAEETTIPQEAPGLLASGRRRPRLLLAGIPLVLLLAGGGYLLFRKQPHPAPSTTTQPPIKSIAVLPFKPLVAAEQDESLEIGMADTLITRLGRIEQLTVRPTSAVRQYTKLDDEAVKAGQELVVDAVLDGSIQKSGDRVRVVVRLVSVDQAQTLWTEQFDETFLNIFAVQDAISRKVAERLVVQLGSLENARLGKHETDSSEAYELCLKGRYFWNKFTPADHQKATEYFNQAIAKDPGYAVAYAGLADTYGASATNGWLRPNEAYPKAKLIVQKALSLDDTLAEAHANLGALFMFYDLDWVSAEREYRRAIELNPDYEGTYEVYSYLLCALGRPDEGIEKARRGLEANPLSGSLGNDLALAFYLARRYDEASKQSQKTLEMEPARGETLLALGVVYEQKGMFDAAINEYQKAIKSLGRATPILAQLGHAYAISGKRTEAMSIVGELKEVSKQSFRGSYDLAILYTGLGERDKAFEQLNKAYEERSGWIINLKVEPQFDSLRGDPRYASLLRRLNL